MEQEIRKTEIFHFEAVVNAHQNQPKNFLSLLQFEKTFIKGRGHEGEGTDFMAVGNIPLLADY